MSVALVDSNVLLDIFTEDPRWYQWSVAALARCAEDHILALNPIIYAEVSSRFATVEALPVATFQRLDLPWEALAGSFSASEMAE